MTVKDDWDEKYYPPAVERKIVGYSGLDPARKFSAEDREEIADVAEAVLSAVVNIQVGD